jgi:hypothetical protein
MTVFRLLLFKKSSKNLSALILGVCLITACGADYSDQAVCRIDESISLDQTKTTITQAACVLRFDQRVLLFSDNASHWSLLHGNTGSEVRALCAAHAAVVAATGYNPKIVELGEQLPSGLQLLSCQLDNALAVAHLPRQYRNGKIAQLHDPYTLTHLDLVNADLLIPLRKTYKSTPASKPALHSVNNSATINP